MALEKSGTVQAEEAAQDETATLEGGCCLGLLSYFVWAESKHPFSKKGVEQAELKFLGWESLESGSDFEPAEQPLAWDWMETASKPAIHQFLAEAEYLGVILSSWVVGIAVREFEFLELKEQYQGKGRCLAEGWVSIETS
jgi:hypothetical protein